MTETPSELRALAHIVHTIRPAWPVPVIEQALTDDVRDLPILTTAAVAAATNPKTRHPQGIRTTFPGSDDCTVCAQRAKAEHAGPPRALTCGHCGKPDTPGHRCSVNRPSDAWHQARKLLATRYEPRIRDARKQRTVEGNDLAEQLIREQMNALNDFGRLTPAEQSAWLAEAAEMSTIRPEVTP